MARILYIDDQPELGEAALRAALPEQHPLNVIDTSEDAWKVRLKAEAGLADIVVSDFVLDRSVAPDPLDPVDGQAMNGVVQSLHRLAGHAALYTIYSGGLDNEIDARRLPGSPYLWAKSFGADWVGRKPPATAFPGELRILANAVDRMVDVPDSDEKYAEWIEGRLDLPEAEWRSEALEQIRNATLPVENLARPANKLDVVRWLITAGLRFPVFLLGPEEVAVRLRLNVDWWKERLASDVDTAGAFGAGVLYAGPLTGLEGPRWWRAGIDAWIWESTDGNASDPAAMLAAVKKALGTDPEVTTVTDPVLVYDEHGVPTDDIVGVDAAVRISPPDWPAAAGRAWARLDAARQKPLLRAIVAPEDQDRLEE